MKIELIKQETALEICFWVKINETYSGASRVFFDEDNAREFYNHAIEELKGKKIQDGETVLATITL